MTSYSGRCQWVTIAGLIGPDLSAMWAGLFWATPACGPQIMFGHRVGWADCGQYLHDCCGWLGRCGDLRLIILTGSGQYLQEYYTHLYFLQNIQYHRGGFSVEDHTH